MGGNDRVWRQLMMSVLRRKVQRLLGGLLRWRQVVEPFFPGLVDKRSNIGFESLKRKKR